MLHFFNIISFILPSRFYLIRRLILKIAGCNILANVKINANSIICGNSIFIGKETWIGPSVQIYSSFKQDEKIHIGNFCDIGPSVIITNGSHEIGLSDRRAGKGFCSRITIGDGCWIGARSLILGGVTIGNGTIIAAGSVVKPGNYPSNCLLAGVPAVVKKKLNDINYEL